MKIILNYSFITLVAAGFLFSCKQSSNNDTKLYKSMEEGFENSNVTIKNATDNIYRSAMAKLANPSTAERMKQWFPKIESIRSASSGIINYIQQIKTALKENASKGKDGENTYDSNDVKAVNAILTAGTINKLNEELDNYKAKVLSVDSIFRIRFQNNIAVKNIPGINNWQSGKEDIFYAKNIPASFCLAVLTKLENNIFITENNFVEYCYEQVGMLDGPVFFDSYGVLVGQSANILKAGKELTISAGVGAYSSAAKADIIINNRKVECVDGSAVYKLRVPKKPGNYSIPVIINFLDKQNNPKRVKIDVEYEVSALQ